MSQKTYTILLDPERTGKKEGTVKISEEGALIIWDAYEKMFGTNCQKMETRESRGGVCWLSEIDYFKDNLALDEDFDYTDYIVE